MLELHCPAATVQWLAQRVRGTLRSDSRTVQPGDGFVAWPGSGNDARRFVAAALARGASAVLIESDDCPDDVPRNDERVACYRGLQAACGPIAAEFFEHPSCRLALVAVTGTNGKTSTTWWLAQALAALQPKPWPSAVVGTLGVGRPDPTQIRSTGLTTPDPVLLQATLRQFVSEGVRACAIEASSIGIEEQRLAGCRVRVAVFTNFTQDHLDYHGHMQAYWQAKRKLFDWAGLQAAVVNVDDPQGAKLAAELLTEPAGGALDLWTVSQRGSARLQARAVGFDGGLVCEVVESGHEALPLRTRLIGSYNLDNLLAVIGSLRALGVALGAALQACQHLQPVPGRMEWVGEGADLPLVAVDYAHTPDALAQALQALQALARQRGGRLWCVFGCGGDRDATKRPQMGAMAARHADCVVVTSDNPRSERPEAIISQILLGLPSSGRVSVQVERERAIEQAILRADAADVVLIAGKGHEATQDIGGVQRPFLDRDHAQRALQRRHSARQEALA